MATFQIVKQATTGRALQAVVRFIATNGRTEDRELTWPADTAPSAIAAVLKKMAEQFERKTPGEI